MMDCAAAREAAVAFLTGELEAQEAVGLLDHIVHCPGCTHYLREAAQAFHLLPYGLPPVPPPPHLRERVLATVRQEAGGRAHDTARGWRLWLERCRRALSVAAVLLWGVTVALLWMTHREQRLLAERLAAGDRQVQAAAALLGEGSTRAVRTVALERQKGFPESWGHLTLFETRYGTVAIVAVGGLPAPEREQVYRLWLIREGARADGGSFRPDAAGFGALIVQRADFPFDAVGITLEPDPQATPGPRGPRVLFGALDGADDALRPSTPGP